jgi:NADH-quinone oxidoreductase subunit A
MIESFAEILLTTDPSDGRFMTLFIYVGLLVGIALLSMTVIGPMFGPKRRGRTKESPYECGSPIKQATRSPFDVRFFMLAMLFILFDIETVLLIPYLVQYKHPAFGVEGLIIAGIFFFGLVESLIYAWKKGALDWK